MRSSIVTKITSVAASVSMFAVMTGTAHAAGTASLTISGGSVQTGNTITAVIRETSTDPVVSVQADLIFDASKLQCVSVDGSSSAFAVQYQGTCGANSVSVARGTTGTTLTGTQTVATVTFKAIAPGAASISFAATSGLYRSPDAAAVWDGNTTGTSIAISNAPAATPAPTAAPVVNKPAATATPTRAVAAAVTAEATPAPTTEATPTPAPTATPEVAPTAAPIPTATDTTRAVSNSTIGSIIAVVAAGAAALFVVRRKQQQ